MKKSLPLLMLFMFSWSITKADTEPGNNAPGTTTDVLPLNGSQSGTIGASDNDDYYKLATNADGNITVSLTNTDNAYTYIYLYDSDGTTQLGTVSGYGLAGISFTVNGLSVGNYFVRVYSTNATASNYTVSNTLAADAVPNDIEPNDDYTQALTIAPNGTKKGHLAYRYNGGTFDASDYYKLTTTTDGNITINLSNDDNGYTYIYLYDNDGTTQLGTASNYGLAGISFTVNGLGVGTYYIRVYTNSSSYYSGYTLSNTITPATLANDAEPNDLSTQSVSIAPNTSTTGHIGYRYNGGSIDGSDYYKLITTTDGDITVNLSNDDNGYTYIYLYDSDGTTQLGSTSNYGQVGISFTVHGRAAGTYYILVYTNANSYYSSYTLSTATTATTYNDTEPNNTPAQAVTLNENDSTKGHIGYEYNGGSIDGSDYYKLITTKDGNITISLKNDNNGYTYINLYDQDGTTQLGSTSGYALGGISFTVNGLAAGTYYVLVYTNANAYYNTYTLYNTVNPATYTNDIEPNDAFATATTLNNDSAKSGHICYRFNGGAIDYYDYRKVIMYTAGSMGIDISMANTNYSYVYLYDPAQNQIFSQSGYNSSYSINFPSLAAGNYYLLVYSSSNSYYNSYKITRFAVPCNQDPSVITAGGATTFCQGGSVTLHSTIEYATYAWSNGGTTRDITVNSTGNYTLLGTDYDGCATHASNSIPVTVNPIPATPTISTGGAATTFCQGGSVTLTSSVATSYLWSPGGETTQSITVSSNGNYGVTVKNAAGCSSLPSAATTVTVNPLPAIPTISASGPITFCAGGSVTLTSSSATNNLWSPGGQTTQSITVTTNGNYSVKVTNANNCSASSAATTVTVNPLPSTPTISAGGPITFCAGGSVTLTSSSATNNLWSPGGQTTQSITVTANGNYSVTVTNANNCSATSAATTVTVNPLPTVTLTAFTAVCLTDAAFTLSGGSPAGGTYSGTGVSGGQFNPSTAGVGTFPITYSYTNANNCTATATQSITVNNCTAPCTASISPGGPTTFCQGGSVTLTASAGVSWLWSPGGQTTQSITVTSGGTYSCAVTDANNCTAITPGITVTVNPLPATPTISASGPITFCAGGSVTLTSSSATNNLWSPGGQTTQSITVTTNGNYSVKVTNANNCSASSAATTVTVNPLPATPTISANGPTTFCAGGSVTLTSSSATNNLWSPGGQTTQSITVTANGNYSVTVSNANNCSATSAATAVTVNPLPTVTLSTFTAVCSTDAAFTLTGGSPAGGTYSGTGVSGGQFNPATAGVGTFPISYSYTNANNCTATATQSITVNSCGGCTATITADKATTFCQGGSVVLTASAGASWLWSPGGQTTQSITVSSNGSYTVTVTNANNCSATSAPMVVTVNPLPVIPIISASGPTAFCQGESITLTSSAATSYLWSTGATTQSITVNANGNYSVTVKNASGCSASSAATTVTVNPLPAIPTISAGGPTTFCLGGSVTLTSSSATNNLWSTGATTQAITVTASGNYTVKVTNANNCSSTSAATVVTANNCGGVYCSANGNSKNKGYIANVFLRTIFNTTGWSPGGYGNYLNQSTTLNKRYDYVISVTPGYNSFIGAAPLYTRVWIDWNQDGDFNDPGELVFAPTGSSYFLRLGVIDVPNNALNGTTRMRVAVGADAVPTNCGSFAYGEVEDYTIVVGNGTWYRTEQPTEEPAVTLNNTFNVYPNPVSEELVIQRQSNDNSKVVLTTTAMQIADMNGRIVLSSNLTRSTEVISVRKLPAGVYIVRLRSGDSVTTKKIIIAH